MIILLKIILGLFVLLDFFVARILFIDFRNTIKTEAFEEAPVAAKIRVKFIFYFTFIVLIAFAALMVMYEIAPLQWGS
jgi:hypothetical protein